MKEAVSVSTINQYSLGAIVESATKMDLKFTGTMGIYCDTIYVFFNASDTSKLNSFEELTLIIIFTAVITAYRPRDASKEQSTIELTK